MQARRDFIKFDTFTPQSRAMVASCAGNHASAPQPREGEMARDQLSWVRVDTSTLTPELAEMYQGYQEAKHRFEDALQIKLGKSLAFSYKHGELSVAVVERKAEKGKVSLSEFMAKQQANGDRS